MAGELDRIGGNRGAIRLFEVLIRIVLKRNIPKAIVEKLLWDLLTDLIKEVVNGEKDPKKRTVALILPPIQLAPNLSLPVPKNAIGIRWDVTVDESYGRIPGRGVVPDNFGLNPFSDTPFWLGFGAPLFNYGLKKPEYKTGALLFAELPVTPTNVYVYCREGITGTVNFLRYR